METGICHLGKWSTSGLPQFRGLERMVFTVPDDPEGTFDTRQKGGTLNVATSIVQVGFNMDSESAEIGV